MEVRDARLKTLPQSERLLKKALIKKKEGRILDASEKHALKMSSENGELLRLWEKLRTISVGGENNNEEEQTVAEKKTTAFAHKYPIVGQLMKLIEPKFDSAVRTPSVSRVLQSMVKYGSTEQVEKLTNWMVKDIAAVATDAYGHFVVMSLIRHATRTTFDTLLKALAPAVPRLITHKFGVHVLHSAYSSRWCSSVDRNVLLLGIFKDNMTVMKRWTGFPDLESILLQNPALRQRLLTRLFDVVEKLISQKEAVEFPYVQRLAYAFLKAGTRDEVSELCDSLRPHLANIASTRDGAPLASLAFSLTHPKKRKEILRDFKDKLGELATGKYSAPVVGRFFDLLYDVQLLNKYIAGDMVEHIGQIINNEFGYRIIMHLLTPHLSRKERFLLPNWMEHNLFSIENEQWNRHTWLTPNYESEEVEICSKPAMTSHLQALPSLVKSFMEYAKDEKNASKLNRHHAALLSREILTVVKSEPEYKAALQLSQSEIKLLQKLSPAAGVKRERENDTDDSEPLKKEKKVKQVGKARVKKGEKTKKV